MPKTQTLRRGISLLEVLVSIGVLSVGLLGVLALMPAASNQAKIGAQEDAAAILARRAFREMNVRWYGRSVALNSPAPAFPSFYAIDPLGVSLRSAAGMTGNSLSFLGDPSTVPALSAHRRTFFSPTLTNPAFDEVFRSGDDLSFGDQGSGENPAPNPPQQVAMMATDSAGALQPVKRFTDGNLSWFTTVAPRATGFNTVSVAVVNKRTTEEYSALTHADSTVVGGVGQIEIAFTPGAPQEAWTNVKPGDWLLLVSRGPSMSTADWYRVQSSGTYDHNTFDGDDRPDRYTYTVTGNDLRAVSILRDPDPKRHCRSFKKSTGHAVTYSTRGRCPF